MSAPAVIGPPELHPVARCRWCQRQFRRYDERHWICTTEQCAERQLALAMYRAGGGGAPLFIPFPLQVEVEENTTRNLLIAGAAGVSKSTASRWSLYRACRKIPGYRAMILRTTFPELERNHLQFMPLEAEQLGDADYKNRTMTFHHDDGNDAVILAGHSDDAASIPKHLGV